MRASEFTTNVDINQHLDGGDLEGYVTDTDKINYRNYLESQGADQELIDHIGQKYDRIGILRNMYVDDDMRNQGIGNQLVGSAIDDAIELGAKAIILVADMSESNEIDLQKWYKGFGFSTIGQAGSDPVMLLEL